MALLLPPASLVTLATPLLHIRGKVKESSFPLSNGHNFLLEDSDPGASSGPQNTAETLHLACCS